jgi:hypothetical protein
LLAAVGAGETILRQAPAVPAAVLTVQLKAALHRLLLLQTQAAAVVAVVALMLLGLDLMAVLVL